MVNECLSRSKTGKLKLNKAKEARPKTGCRNRAGEERKKDPTERAPTPLMYGLLPRCAAGLPMLPMSEHCVFSALVCGLAGAHSHISFLLLHDRGGHSHAPCPSSPGISPKSTRLSLARPHGASHNWVRTGHRQGCALAPTPMLESHSSRSGIALTPFFSAQHFPQTAE